MRLLIDGDACPNKDEIKELAMKYHIEMIVFVDYAHMMEDDYYQTIHCEIGRDSVDMAIVNASLPDDLVITQDYGLASLLIGKRVKVLHVSGMVIDEGNIDELLMTRYISAKQRKSQKHLKGPSKRTQEVKHRFLDELNCFFERNMQREDNSIK